MELTTVIRKLHNAGQVPKAALYARFSSENQREESIDAQIRAIREFAEKNSIVIVEEYIDKAKSATNDDRENFQAMVKDASKGNFQFVIVHKLDRFARNRRDAVGYRVELARKGVMLVSTLENYDDDTPEGALMQGLSELLAEFYSKNLSREIKKGQKENALCAKHNGGTPPFGYDVDPDTRKLVINTVEANGVKMIFRMAEERYGYGVILRALREQGYKTKRGKDFGRNSLHDILRNEKYTGVYFYRRIAPSLPGIRSVNSHKYNSREDMIVVDDGVPALIDKAQFESVQKVLNGRKQRGIKTKEHYLLTGKVICGKCGMYYAGSRTVSKKNKFVHVTYRCNGTRKVKELRCNNGLVNKELLEQKVLTGLSEIVFDPTVIPKLVVRVEQAFREKDTEHDNVIINTKKQLKDINRKIENLLSAIESGKGSNLLMNRLEKLELEQKQLEGQIAKEEAHQNTHHVNETKLRVLFTKAKQMLMEGTLEGTKRLVDMFIDKVIINEDTVVIRYNPGAFILDDDGVILEKIIPRDEVRIYRKHKC